MTESTAATAPPGSSGSDLKFGVEKTPSEIILHCTGRITSNTAALFQETVRDLISQTKCLTVDLALVSHIDSAGLGSLVSVWSSARRKSAEVGFRWSESNESSAPHEVKWINFNDYIRKLLRMTQLDKVFGIHDESPRKNA